jgi:hypothetical protein
VLEAQAPRHDPKLIEIQAELIRARSKADRDSSNAIASRNTSPRAQASTIGAPAQPTRAQSWPSDAGSIALAEHEVFAGWAGFDLRYTISKDPDRTSKFVNRISSIPEQKTPKSNRRLCRRISPSTI